MQRCKGNSGSGNKEGSGGSGVFVSRRKKASVWKILIACQEVEFKNLNLSSGAHTYCIGTSSLEALL